MNGERRDNTRRTAGWREKTRPAQPLQQHFREKTPPAGPKTPILGCFQRAGRTFSRTGCSDVAALKPTTPLQPLTKANMKPPSPLLAPEQQPLKPVTPLQPKNTPKTPISHPQRRQGFQPAHLTGPQRRRRFQPGNALHRIGKQCTRSHTITLGTKQSNTPVSSAIPPRNKRGHRDEPSSPNSACNSIV